MTHDGTTTPGRRERPVPPGPLQDFAQGLRDLRGAAGNPSYRAMERKAGYSASALSAAAAGDRLPSLAVTQAYVGACGGDQDEWTRTWYAIKARLDTTTSPPPARPRRRSALLWLALVALGLIALVTAGTLPKNLMAATGPDLAFTAVAAPSCPRDDIRGTPGTGCGNTFQWRFTTGLRGRHQCFVDVSVGSPPLPTRQVRYTVKDGFGDDARTVAEFTLDQHTHQGTWVPVDTSDGLVTVEIADPAGAQSTAAGPVRLSCR
ncbi:helix-turn-helix domain-containing protein [Nonomuraea sp. NPDC003709]|uniref:helix-turn-helix domain-containing protein n=1 Tax=Nonomuraea sp. NPDC003709 TaxID=3154450 RepID=UPI0033A087E1